MNNNIRNTILIIFLLCFQINYSQSTKNYFVNDELPKFKIVASAGCDTNLIFLATSTSAAPYILIINNSGEILFSKKTKGAVYDFKPHQNGLISYYDLGADCHYVMDDTFNLIDSIKCLNNYYTDIHELRILSNGNYLLIGYETHNYDMSRLTEGGKTDATIISHVVQELDKNKNIIFEWKAWGAIGIMDTYADVKQATIDVTHANAIDLDYDGNLLITLRNTQEVIKVDRVTGKVVWRWGGKKNQFTIYNDTLGFSWQHAARRISNGNIVLFDNGFKREPSIMSFSRSLEYQLDEVNKTAKLVWSYRNSPDIYSIGLGYSQRLPNGNTFISWGAAIPAITEVTNSGNKVFELSILQNYYTYRAYRFPFYPNIIQGGDKIATDKPSYLIAINSIYDTSSVNIKLINNNNHDVIVNSISNTERCFYITDELPFIIKKNSSYKLKIYCRPNLTGKNEDKFIVNTSINNFEIPVTCEIKTNVVRGIQELLNSGDVIKNYPNPFNAQTQFVISLMEESKVDLELYSLLGERIELINNKIFSKGRKTLTWDARSFSSGIYFCVLKITSLINNNSCYYKTKVTLLK